MTRPGVLDNDPRVTDLIQFYIYILIETKGNASSISCLRRDCLVRHIVEADHWILRWDKKRAHDNENVYHVTNLSDPLNLKLVIDFLLRWTSAVAKRADSTIAEFLFLHDSGTPRRPHRIGHLRWNKNISKGQKAHQIFAKQHGLTKFRYRQLRETTVIQRFLKSGNVLQVKDDLQHSSLESTGYYLKSKTAIIKRFEVITEAQNRFSSVLSASAPPKAAAIDAPIDEAVKILELPRPAAEANIEGRYDVGTNGCRNPYNSPFMQKKGALCRQYWACFFCRNAFFAREHLPRLILLKRSISEKQESLSKEQWLSVYGPIAHQVTMRIGQYSGSSISRASLIADSMPKYVGAVMLRDLLAIA